MLWYFTTQSRFRAGQRVTEDGKGVVMCSLPRESASWGVKKSVERGELTFIVMMNSRQSVQMIWIDRWRFKAKKAIEI